MKRLIDADKLKKCAIPCEIHNGALTEMCVPLYQIDNAPTVSEITKEKLSIAYDQGYKDGRDNWLQEEPKGDLISRAALKKALKSNCTPEICHDFGTNWCEACCPHNDFEDLIDEAPTVEQWIPVSERLPNTLGVYNVTRKLKEGETIYFISGASYFDGQNTWYDDTGINHGRPYLTDIIAWQPLPEPYQKGDEEHD